MGTLYEIDADGNRTYTGAYIEKGILVIDNPSNADLQEIDPADPAYQFTGIEDVAILKFINLAGNRNIDGLPEPAVEGTRLLIVNASNADLTLRREEGGGNNWPSAAKIANNDEKDTKLKSNSAAGGSCCYLIYIEDRWRSVTDETW